MKRFFAIAAAFVVIGALMIMNYNRPNRNSGPNTLSAPNRAHTLSTPNRANTVKDRPQASSITATPEGRITMQSTSAGMPIAIGQLPNWFGNNTGTGAGAGTGTNWPNITVPSIPANPTAPGGGLPAIPGFPSGNLPIGNPTGRTPATPTTPTTPVPTAPSATPAAPSATTPPASDWTASGEFEQQVLQLVNSERAKAGLGALTMDDGLNRVARAKAEDMYNNNYFDHNSPTYGSPFDMMQRFGLTFRSAGENIAKGQTSPQQVMNDWMNSAGHRANILGASFTKIGIAYYNGEWVQEFTG